MTSRRGKNLAASRSMADSSGPAGYANDSVYHAVEWISNANTGQESFRHKLCEALGLEPARTEIAPSKVLYRPYELARVLLHVEAAAGGSASSTSTGEFLLEIRSEESRAEMESSQTTGGAEAARPVSPVIIMPDRNLAGWALMDSPAIPQLGALVKPQAAEDLLVRAGLLKAGEMFKLFSVSAHDLQRRADLTWHGGANHERYHLTVVNDYEAATAAFNHYQISSWNDPSASGYTVPQYIYYHPELRVLVTKEIPGVPFSRVLTRCVPVQFSEVGTALAALHSLTASPPEIWTPAIELAGLAEDVKRLERALPNLSGRLRKLVRQLEHPPAASCTLRAPIHGSLSCTAIKYDYSAQQGRRIGFENWEAFCVGEPHHDLGRLIADVYAATCLAGMDRKTLHVCIESLLDAYGHAGQVTVDYDALRWQTAVALLRYAASKIMGAVPLGWPLLVDAMVAQAEQAVKAVHNPI